MRIAALYDVHGNLPALEAVLAEVEGEGTDLIVFGGDIVSGALPRETLARVTELGDRARLIRGNAERVLGEVKRGERAAGDGPGDGWFAGQLTDDEVAGLAGLPLHAVLDVDELGPVQIVHATPRDDEEVFLETTPEQVVAPMLAAAAAPLVVCGHTHMQFDRRLAGRRVVNAGSVGWPYEAAPGAYWALLGPDVELRRTEYDLGRAADRIAASGWPLAEEFARENVLTVPSRAEALAAFEPRVVRGA